MSLTFILDSSVTMLYFVKCQVENKYKLYSLFKAFCPTLPLRGVKVFMAAIASFSVAHENYANRLTEPENLYIPGWMFV